MYTFNIVVRWANGDYEGFGASGLSKDVAYQRAIDKAHRKAASFPGDCGFDELTATEYNNLPSDIQDEIRMEWGMGE